MTVKSVSARGRKAKKPSKPRKDFPLTAHPCGQWSKKIKGKVHYFGVWDDPAEAERKWDRQKDALLAGREPDESSHGDSVGWLCNEFMDSKQLQLERDELKKRTLNDYLKVCKHVAAYFGKGRRLDSLRSSDFERYRNSLPDTWGPTTINNHLRSARVLFKFANDIEATDRSIRYEKGLKGVPKSKVRKDRASKPAKDFTLDEVHRLLSHAEAPMKAFILLGLNAAYGTADIGRLKTSDIDFKKNWLGQYRGKTGVARGCWLWPETIKAIKEAIEAKPDTRIESRQDLFSLTRNRQPWYTDGDDNNPLTQAFRKLKLAAKVKRDGVGHYGLRHTFATLAQECEDQQATDHIMGHLDDSMSALYPGGFPPERIRRVCQHVRKRFLAAKPKPKKSKGKI